LKLKKSLNSLNLDLLDALSLAVALALGSVAVTGTSSLEGADWEGEGDGSD
jgi:hypothetical protein